MLGGGEDVCGKGGGEGLDVSSQEEPVWFHGHFSHSVSPHTPLLQMHVHSLVFLSFRLFCCGSQASIGKTCAHERVVRVVGGRLAVNA